MAIKTTLEQLEEVQATISKVLQSQDYTVAGRRNARAALATLQERETLLLDRYRRESGSGGPVINVGTLRRD